MCTKIQRSFLIAHFHYLLPVTVILGIKQIPTKIIPLLILFGVNGLLLSTTLDSAPEVYQLAKNRRVDNRVVELELPVEGKNFSLIWVSEKNKQWGKNLRSRKGTHLYGIATLVPTYAVWLNIQKTKSGNK